MAANDAMKKIKLENSDKHILVDDEDYERLSKYKWSDSNNNGNTVKRTYRRIAGGRLHSVSIGSEILQEKVQLVDHIDKNPYNNQKSNLRLASCAQNMFNKSKQKGSYKSKYKGVSFHEQTKKWRAYICFNEGYKHLGLFVSETDAALAYNEAAIKYFGEFAVLNTIN